MTACICCTCCSGFAAFVEAKPCLRWCDVDLERGLLRIEQSTVWVASTTVTGSPKSAAGVRTVAIDALTMRLLHWHGCQQRLERTQPPRGTGRTDLVFTDPNGGALDPAYASRHFDRLVARHGLPRIRLHDLRHTSASMGLASGESLVEVSRRLGHSSITVTAASTRTSKASAGREGLPG